MIGRVEQLDGQAAEHARSCAVRDAEVDRIAGEIIDRVLAENPSDRQRWKESRTCRSGWR